MIRECIDNSYKVKRAGAMKKKGRSLSVASFFFRPEVTGICLFSGQSGQITGYKPMTAHLHLVQPNNENRSVRAKRQIPTRPSNSELRPREYLTPSEVEKLISAARKGRYGHRDATLILVAYRHGLRAIPDSALGATARPSSRPEPFAAASHLAPTPLLGDLMRFGE